MSSLQPAVLPALAARLFGADPARRLLLLRAIWPQVVGGELARRCELVGLHRNVLRVRVPDATWRKVLFGMRARVLERLRNTGGTLAPERLAFLEGATEAACGLPVLEPSAPAPPDTPAALSAEVSHAADLIPDVEIREGFVRTATRALRRREAQES